MNFSDTPRKKKRILILYSLIGMYGSMGILAYALLVVESTSGESLIRTYSDAYWTLFMSATTIGYGDIVPVTGIGRLLVAIGFYIGVALISFLGIAASAKFFHFPDLGVRNRDLKVMNEKIIKDLHKINHRLDSIQNDLDDIRAKNEGL